MNTFFSSSDMSELHDNTKYHTPFYLSLIVNYAGNYKAKVAFIAEEQTKKIVYKGNTPSKKHELRIQGSELLVHIDCEISFEDPSFVMSDGFKDRFKTIKAENEKKKVIPNKTSFSYPTYTQSSLFEDDDKYFSTTPKFQKNTWNRLDKNVDINRDSVLSFLIKWMAQDNTCEADLKVVYRNILASNKGDQDMLLQLMDENIDQFYTNIFNNTPLSDPTNFNKVMNTCYSILDKELASSEWLEEVQDMIHGYVMVG